MQHPRGGARLRSRPKALTVCHRAPEDSPRHRPTPPGHYLFAHGRNVPSTALTFKVDQVFVQTPGPCAGRQLDLSAEP
jgi:hypothetical protein